MGDTQKYNKALEGIKELYKMLLDKNIITKGGEISSKFIQIFPELEDNNEKIRKEIISALKYANHKGVYDKHIAWLENQSEKKEKIFNADDWCVSKVDGQIHKVSYYEHESNNEAQPKFEIGNWIIYDRHIRKIKDLDSVCYFVEDIDDNTGTPSISYINDHYKLWNIQDAKPGDILCTSGFVFQFKEIRNDGGVSYYCANEKELHEGDDSTFHVAAKQSLMGYANTGLTYYEPATKEQRDLLFKKMKEAGYEWDDKKLELRKTEQIFDDEIIIKPKFKIGDWITDGKYTWYINSIHGAFYNIISQDGTNEVDDINYVDDNFRLWNIQDIKSGDIITSGKLTIIFKKFEGKSEWNFVIAYAGIDIKGNLQITDEHWLIDNNIATLANKEQCDLLFKKLNEEGYEWDSKKLEIRKIIKSKEKNEDLAKFIDERMKLSGEIKKILSNKELAISFLKNAGIIDENGELSEMYKS